jgi:hypothetical protein
VPFGAYVIIQVCNLVVLSVKNMNLTDQIELQHPHPNTAANARLLRPDLLGSNAILRLVSSQPLPSHPFFFPLTPTK